MTPTPLLISKHSTPLLRGGERPRRLGFPAVLGLVVCAASWLVACGDSEPPPTEPDATIEAGAEAGLDATPSPDAEVQLERLVIVTLDGERLPDALVIQGGTERHWRTDSSGELTITLDPTAIQPWMILASHPDARIDGFPAYATSTDTVTIALVRFDPSDNESYVFQHPGTPEMRADTSFCAHCHQTINAAWYASPHRTTASNPIVHDVYAGTANALGTQEVCEIAGGRWGEGRAPGGRSGVGRCYLGGGVLPDLNESCDPGEPCDEGATEFGGCADCHAPGIDGALGGRDFLEASGIAYQFGVHCDVCHKVAGVDLDQPAGVAGRLQIIRPSEPTPSRLLAPDFWPLTFGPFPDVMNPRMGSVHRDTHRGAEFCAGCHQLEQPALVAGATVNPDRWPSGRVPIQSTYAEWSAGPLADAAPCQSCHMPPDPSVSNSSDLQLFEGAEGPSGGWPRPPGAVRAHIWAGPRQPEFEMLQLAGALFIEEEVGAGELRVRVRVKNVGAGHAIPTGEPMRHLVLTVRASCGGEPLVATGGHAIPDYGGYLARKERGEDWSGWPGAHVGQVVRVVRRTGEWHDYEGVSPFVSGGFPADERGMPVEIVVGERRITAVDGGRVTFDAPLPDGDTAYLGDPLVDLGGASSAPAIAGAPGFAFARVTVDADGNRMAMGHRAVDIASDNRLMPQASWTSEHRFGSSCEDPVVTAQLSHRAYPFDLARERFWNLRDTLMTEGSR